MSLGDFRRGWEQMGAGGEVLEKFALGFKRLQDAVAAVEDFLGMQTCDGTGRSVSLSLSAGERWPPPLYCTTWDCVFVSD